MLGIRGGSPKKRKATKQNANPFDEDVVPEYPNAVDANHYQVAFDNGILIGAMTKDGMDVHAMLTQADGVTLDTVINHLNVGTAHTNVRLEDVAEMVPFISSMKRVSKLAENSIDKFKTLMAGRLWLLGCAEVGGPFKMDTLVAFVRGVRALK